MDDINKPDWWIYKGTGKTHNNIDKIPDPPSWRTFSDERKKERGKLFIHTDKEEIEMVNAALYLRRPLLVTGKPGVGKTSLAYSVAYELGLGNVLRWSITTASTLQDGLYRYDAIARLQDASLHKDNLPDISRYLRLGPLGTAFAATKRPRVLLIDEIDKSDIDLPNNLLHIFEEGEFEIPELSRLPDEDNYRIINVLPCDKGEKIPIERGIVKCRKFPLVIMTSNGEREFPPAFLRRCLSLDMKEPDSAQLTEIVKSHMKEIDENAIAKLISEFISKRETDTLATDQFLNAVYFSMHNIDPLHREKEDLGRNLADVLWKSLSDREYK